MTFDLWIHILELVLVGGIFTLSYWVLKKVPAAKGRKKP